MKNNLWLLLFLLGSCTPEPISIPLEQQFGSLPETVLSPLENPITPEKIALGKLLFWDPILSGNKDVACATCHHPDHDYAEQIDLSRGVGGKGLSAERMGGHLVKRNAMTILNVAFNGIDADGHYDPSNTVAFWDNRAQTLEEQALLPIHSAEEMRGTAIAEEAILDTVITRLEAIAEYKTHFMAAFGNKTITADRIAQALAAFERDLLANNSRFDQYARGEEQALSAIEIRGMLAFIEAGCANCHNGPMFSDFELHTLGVPENSQLDFPDDGAGKHQFRTGSLRNLSKTGPYMHNGVFNSLEEVLDFYDDFDEDVNLSVPLSQLDPKLELVEIQDDQRAAIIAFLNSLSDDSFDKVIPEHVPSGLPVGGNID